MLNQSVLISLGVVMVCFNVFADTTISVDVGNDEQNNTNSMLSVDTELKHSKKLFFGAGNSKGPSGNQTIENKIAFIGMSKKMNDDWKLKGMFEYSGLRDAFAMYSTSLATKYSQTNYYVELVPAIRRISLTTLANKKVIISSTALGLKAGVYLGDYLRLSGSAYSYSYSKDVSKLASFASTRFFNVKTLLLSSGLLKNSYNTEAGLDFDKFSISLGKNRSVSAIDYTNSDYVYSVVDFYLSDAWGLSLLYGEYANTPEDQNNFSSLTVNYTF